MSSRWIGQSPYGHQSTHRCWSKAIIIRRYYIIESVIGVNYDGGWIWKLRSNETDNMTCPVLWCMRVFVDGMYLITDAVCRTNHSSSLWCPVGGRVRFRLVGLSCHWIPEVSGRINRGRTTMRANSNAKRTPSTLATALYEIFPGRFENVAATEHFRCGVSRRAPR